MASTDCVKQYLAYWFQLGKKLWIRNGQQSLCPRSIVCGDRYSPEFEACWELVGSLDSGECYLEGMPQTIEQLLSPEWELVPCVRCDILVPLRDRGLPHSECPCSDIPTWPNMELPQPRLPVNSRSHLSEIRSRLQAGKFEARNSEITPGSSREI